MTMVDAKDINAANPLIPVTIPTTVESWNNLISQFQKLKGEIA